MPSPSSSPACVCASLVALSLGCSAAEHGASGALAGGASGSGNAGRSGGEAAPGAGGTVALGGGSGQDVSFAGSGGSAGAANSAQTCDGRLVGYVRDFTPHHLDFEVAASSLDAKYPPRPPGKIFDFDPGIVAAALDGDFKPVYAGDAVTGTKTTTGKANFDQWFRDTPGVNQGMELELEFTDPDGDEKFTFDNGGQQWFPIDGQLLGNYPEFEGGIHNYHMTFELHSKFIYHPGMVFDFAGDDDVWVFIDDRLVIDLGGIHVKMAQSVELDALGLTAGETYHLDFFWAERHVEESNFKLETSIEFVDCGIPVVK